MGLDLAIVIKTVVVKRHKISFRVYNSIIYNFLAILRQLHHNEVAEARWWMDDHRDQRQAQAYLV